MRRHGKIEYLLVVCCNSFQRILWFLKDTFLHYVRYQGKAIMASKGTLILMKKWKFHLVNFWQSYFHFWVESFFRPSIHLPVNIVLALAEVARFFREKVLSCKTSNPFVTASTLQSFTSTRTFDCSNAERVIGYSPIVSLEVHISFLFSLLFVTLN